MANRQCHPKRDFAIPLIAGSGRVRAATALVIIATPLRPLDPGIVPMPAAGRLMAILPHALGLAILVAGCFGPVLFRDEQFAYRDAAHITIRSISARPSMAIGPRAALGPLGKRRDAAAGQPHGGRALSRQAGFAICPSPGRRDLPIGHVAWPSGR